jgi:hypothetical protein
MNKLRAISIKQPWLDLILHGKKKLELRGWNPSFRGSIALHSPMKIDFHAAHYFGYTEPWELNRGKVLGMANLTSVTQLNEKSYIETLTDHLSVQPFAGIIYAIEFSNIFVLPEPVAAKGKLILFSLEEEISENVINQLPSNNSFHQI